MLAAHLALLAHIIEHLEFLLSKSDLELKCMLPTDFRREIDAPMFMFPFDNNAIIWDWGTFMGRDGAARRAQLQAFYACVVNERDAVSRYCTQLDEEILRRARAQRWRICAIAKDNAVLIIQQATQITVVFSLFTIIVFAFYFLQV